MAKKDKKLKKNKKLKNVTIQERMYDAVIDNKPMSQIVHWTIIVATASVFGLQMTNAALVLENVGK